MTITIILLSILFQFSATVLALRLIRITKRSTAWLLIASAITLMPSGVSSRSFITSREDPETQTSSSKPSVSSYRP
jgi:apolipoprotein N-acyltransferase